MRLENTIIKNLIHNNEFVRKVAPFIKYEYFSKNSDKLIVKNVLSFINKYNNLPSHESLVIGFTSMDKITDSELKEVLETLSEVNESKQETSDIKWLVDRAEKFCQERAIYNAIMESISIIDDKNGTKSKGAIPGILSDALGVSFDTHVGHDFLEDYSSRYDFYHKKEERIPFDLEYFNKITKGGVPSKTLNVILAGTGVGKSLFMCHVAASCLAQNKNVLYITLEMAEERIAERIDANLLNINLDDLEKISKDMYEKKFNALRTRVQGKLIIKEYPTASASVTNFRSLVDELKLKRNFKPDIIFIDYLNICASSRMKHGSNVNSYTYIKAIAEELRGFAVEQDVPIFSATQTTRSGFTNTDPGLEDTSESFGLPATADFMFALIATEELHQLNQIMVKQLKNRYSDPTDNKRFVIGVDRPKMKLYDVEESAQKDIVDSGQDDDDKPINTFGTRERRIKQKFEVMI